MHYPFRYHNFLDVEYRKLFQRAPSPSDFPLLNYFWIYFTCGFGIRDGLFGSLVTHYGPERVKQCVPKLFVYIFFLQGVVFRTWKSCLVTLWKTNRFILSSFGTSIHRNVLSYCCFFNTASVYTFNTIPCSFVASTVWHFALPMRFHTTGLSNLKVEQHYRAGLLNNHSVCYSLLSDCYFNMECRKRNPSILP